MYRNRREKHATQIRLSPSAPSARPRPLSLTYAYDSNHRLLSVTGGGKTTAFTYDTDPNSQLTAQNAWGRMTTASNDGYTWHFSYDNMGRVNQQTLQTPNAWTHATYAYDADGRLATVGYPGDLASTISGMQAVNPCQYSYTILGRATGYQCWGPDGQQWLGLAHDATYNAAGQILGWSETSLTWNGSNAYWNYPYNLSRTYDPARGWITDMGESGWYPSSMSLHYNYQANGQLASEVNSSSGGSVTTSYTYDNLNRLATVGTGTWNMTFAYDEFGNRTSQTGSGGAPVSVLTYDSGTNRINSAGYSYDGAGNLTAMPLPQGASMGLTYDVFDRLVEADTHPASGQTTTSTMAYDAFGRRIAKTSLGAVYFYDASGRQLTSYLGTFVNGVYYYFAGQRLYNWTDRQGSLKGFYGTTSYYPYGEDVGTSTGNDNYKFAQTYRDSDSGLDYAGSRYYASGIGRFLTGDSFDASASTNSPQSWNRYAYVQNDPVNYYDPSGRLLADVGTCDWFWYESGGDACDMGGWGYWGWFGGVVGGAVGGGPSGSSSSSSSGPCYDQMAAVIGTLDDIGLNMMSVAEQGNSKVGGITNQADLQTLQALILSATATEIGNIGGEEELNPNQKPSEFVGGHFNLNLDQTAIDKALGGLHSADDNTFKALFEGNKRNTANWVLGDSGYNMHSKLKGTTLGTHFDVFNPRQFPTGTLGHAVVDMGIGTLSGKCLDPAWQ